MNDPQSRTGDDRTTEGKRLAVVIHAFYVEFFDECIGWLKRLDIPHDIFITVPSNRRPAIDAFLNRRNLQATVIEVVNRGRDVAPFLKVMQVIDARRHSRILKLHTKSTKPDARAGLWRQSLYRDLTDVSTLKKALAIFDRAPEVGILGGSDHLLCMQPFPSRNEQVISRLAERMGVSDVNFATDIFFAGTMFIAQTRALRPLSDLGLSAEDFEPEQGQRNGTLAHAVERAVSYSARAAGLRVAAFDTTIGMTPADLIYQGRTLYPFAKAYDR